MQAGERRGREAGDRAATSIYRQAVRAKGKKANGKKERVVTEWNGNEKKMKLAPEKKKKRRQIAMHEHGCYCWWWWWWWGWRA